LTDNKSYLIGKLGKPHGLQGYQYINIDKYFRNIKLNDVLLEIENHSFLVENFKSHLKDRNLIKFKHINSIDEAENHRDLDIYISGKYRTLKNKDLLPWPGFFINYELKNGEILLDYFYSSNLTLCNVKKNDEVIVVTYDKDNFFYEDDILDLTIN
tara:strand:+ start:114 stop:581 length:468 start_codon:yes stop_codon:yes gene_type:complete